MTKPWRSHDEATAEMFREDPALAAAYLNDVLEDGDQAEVLVALRHIVNSRSSIQKVAEQTELNATTLYRTLSPAGNPELRSLTKVLGAVGLRLSIVPVRA
jgi:probable addiction module antidote protein